MMNLPQERVLLPERNGNALGGFLAVGDVAGDFRDAHDLAGGVFDREIVMAMSMRHPSLRLRPASKLATRWPR